MRLRRLFFILGLLAIPVLATALPEDPPVFVLKWGSWGFGPGQFEYPYGLAADAQGNVYVADKGNDRIQKFRGDGTFIRQWGGGGSDPGQFDGPTGIAISADGL